MIELALLLPLGVAALEGSAMSSAQCVVGFRREVYARLRVWRLPTVAGSSCERAGYPYPGLGVWGFARDRLPRDRKPCGGHARNKSTK